MTAAHVKMVQIDMTNKMPKPVVDGYETLYYIWKHAHKAVLGSDGVEVRAANGATIKITVLDAANDILLESWYAGGIKMWERPTSLWTNTPDFWFPKPPKT